MKIPYGIADFHRLRRKGYAYVDRTAHIRRVEALGEPLLFVRPRRFGKSLFLRTLSCYYDLRLAERHDALFGDLAVGREPTSEAHRYFVLVWDFSLISSHGGPEQIGLNLRSYVLSTLRTFLREYRDHLPRPPDVTDDPVATLVELLAAIRETPYRLYPLVDEYDNFANEVITADPATYRALLHTDGPFKQLFKWVKGAMAGDGLERLFLTGVSPLVLADVTSGLNISRNVSLDPQLADLCGFREDEVRNLLQQACAETAGAPPVDDALQMMRVWYDGYRFAPAGPPVYNPTLVFYFLLHLLEQGGYPRQMLDSNLAVDEGKLRTLGSAVSGQQAMLDLIQTGKPLEVDRIVERFPLSDLLDAARADADATSLGSFLYYFGMLTHAGQTAWRSLLLDVPNLVVRKLYLDEIERFLLPAPAERGAARDAALRLQRDGDIAPLTRFVEERVFRALGNRG